MRTSFAVSGKCAVYRMFLLLSFAMAFSYLSPNVCGQATQKDNSDKPRFSEYKGVKIGMSVSETRQKLGKPEEENEVQETFTISEKESARVFFDGEKKVSAIIVTYIGKSNGIPSPEDVLGEKLTAKPDGSMYKMVQFEKAGFWIAYSRTPGDDPLIMITIQKMTVSN